MMMGKQKAAALAREERLTIADLRAMIERQAGAGPLRMGTVNPRIPLERCCEIYLAAIKDRPVDEVPKAWRRDVYSRRPGAMKPSKDFLLVTNILRDCGL